MSDNDNHSGDKTYFENATDRQFVDISSEEWREYEFADKTVRIEKPLLLNVSKSGGHRLFDHSGDSHYIPPVWRHLRWRVRDGKPNFVL